jgi:hypothetical protein
MNANRIGELTQTLTSLPSRRDVLRGLAGAGLGLGGLQLAPVANAKKKHKHKKRKPKAKPNEFGCLEIGDACSNADQCCSGLCEGKKGKKRCQAHNVGGCSLDRSRCFNPAVSPCSATATCLTTTGNAPFCAENTGSSLEANCQICSKDKDCEALGFGAGSACVIFRIEGACTFGCEGINGSTGTACIAPGA